MNQSKGRDNEKKWVDSVNTPPQYLPKVEFEPYCYFSDFLEFVSETWRPVLFGFLCAISLVAWWILG